MLARNVVFYDDRRNVVRTAKTVRLNWQGLQRKRVQRYLAKLRGFSITDIYD